MIATTNVRTGKRSRPHVRIAEARYTVSIARDRREIESALRLRYDVFKREMSDHTSVPAAVGYEFDRYDFACDHLVVFENATGRTVGTYRLNTIENAGGIRGLYSFQEFRLEDLPADLIERGVELGRACIAREHRSSRVLFLLWKGIAAYLRATRKRYFFGCCSIFSDEAAAGQRAYRELARDGFLHPAWFVGPRVEPIQSPPNASADPEAIPLPQLFELYLKLGARVCGPPIVDSEFGTIDFFVVLDVEAMNPRYRNLFFV